MFKIPEALIEEMVNRVSINVMARKVIAGEYGDGQTRKDKLGPQYKEIQNEVDKLMGKYRSKDYERKMGSDWNL